MMRYKIPGFDEIEIKGRQEIGLWFYSEGSYLNTCTNCGAFNTVSRYCPECGAFMVNYEFARRYENDWARKENENGTDD